MPIDRSSVASLFADQTARSIAELPADNGSGALGEWPPDGDHPNTVMDINIKEGVFKGKGGNIPANVIQFRYVTTALLPGRKDPLEWSGVPFTLPRDESQVTDSGNKIRLEIDKKRLKGHLEAILGTPVTDLRAALPDASDRIHRSKCECMVRCTTESRSSSKTAGAAGTVARSYRNEFIVSNLSQA